MAEIVFAAGVPHNPFFPPAVDAGAPAGPEIERLYGAVGERLVAAAPDVIIVFTTDHYNAFFELSVPIFSIATGDMAPGPCDYPNLRQYELALDPELARDLQRRLVAAEFDVGASQELALDHTITAPLSLMIPEIDVPLVPFFVSTSMRPIPSARRCRRLGAAIGAALRDGGLPRRVALLASGAFSFDVGGKRIDEDSHVGVPDPQWLEHVVRRLRDGRLDELVDEITPEQLERAGNASGEILNWIVALGAFAPAPPQFIDLQRDQGHAFAAWSLSG
jgi:aromatic ring-opening dioxygenase catalytic subunit (LigB family)